MTVRCSHLDSARVAEATDQVLLLFADCLALGCAVQHWPEPRQAGASGGAGHTAVPLQVQPRA